jgi:spermidine synthase
VSLYIWTGILSVTLIALALGYRLGGSLASARASTARALQLYALMPAIAALAIVAACLVYPRLFATLANLSLVGGAFAACAVLLFVPLVAASAMNPLLVAILMRREREAGDAGAGKVYFVSTLGSVAGVLATAFVLIPYFSNFAAVLIVAALLAVLTPLTAALSPARVPNRGALIAAGGLGALVAALLLWNADTYTGRQGPYAYGGTTWRLEASYGSLFGTVKVLRSAADPESGRYLRMYFQDGLNQNTVDSNNRSVSFYTYALEALARAYKPDVHGILVLGLGAGMVPMRLAENGAPVEVVDLDPAPHEVARRFIGLDPRKSAAHLADARTFVRGCDGRYDVAIVDLFNGDGTPEYLVTREFFADLKRCLGHGGVAVFNTFADLNRPATYADFLVTLKSELPHLALYRPDAAGAAHVNSFVVASAGPLAAPVKVTFDYVPARHEETLWRMLASPVQLEPRLFTGGRVVTDAANTAAHDYARAQLEYRRSVVEGVPPPMLMN